MSAPTLPPTAPPPLPAARVHAVVALSVITSFGLLGALLAWVDALGAASGCDTYWATYAPAQNPYCDPAFHAFAAYSSPVGVALAAALAVVGVRRARPGGHHGWALAAWATYAGFCAVWWVVVTGA